jgi:hypothetical protein
VDVLDVLLKIRLLLKSLKSRFTEMGALLVVRPDEFDIINAQFDPCQKVLDFFCQLHSRLSSTGTHLNAVEEFETLISSSFASLNIAAAGTGLLMPLKLVALSLLSSHEEFNERLSDPNATENIIQAVPPWKTRALEIVSQATVNPDTERKLSEALDTIESLKLDVKTKASYPLI